MLRVSCHVCGSMLLVDVFPVEKILCPACATVDAAVKKHRSPKRKPPAPAGKGDSDGSG